MKTPTHFRFPHPMAVAVTAAIMISSLVPASAMAQTCQSMVLLPDRPTSTIMLADFEGSELNEWQPGRFFPASEIIDLTIEVTVDDLEPGVHLVEAKLETPNGHHYQTVTAAVSIEATRAGTFHRVQGFPHPLPVTVMSSTGSRGAPGWTARLTLPVAGTSIVTASLYGQWQVSATVDGAALRCQHTQATFIVE